MYSKGKGVGAGMFKQLSSIFLRKSELFQTPESFIAHYYQYPRKYIYSQVLL